MARPEAVARARVEQRLSARCPLWVCMISECLANVIGVIFGLAEQCSDVMILERVNDHRATSVGPYQFALAQQAQLVGDCGFRQVRRQSEIAHTEGRACQGVQDARARVMSPSTCSARTTPVSVVSSGIAARASASASGSSAGRSQPCTGVRSRPDGSGTRRRASHCGRASRCATRRAAPTR